MLATWTVLSVALLATGSFAQIGSLSLNPGLYDLQWDCNPTDNVIVFNISVQAQGWVGFGISPDGNMNNSDVVILLRNGSLLDRHTNGRSVPAMDDSQDWLLLGSGRDGTRRVATFFRALSTGDAGVGTNGQPVDRNIIVGGGVNIIYAWRNAADDDFSMPHDVRGNALDVTLCSAPPPPSPSPEPSPSPDPPVPTMTSEIDFTSSDDVSVTESPTPSPPPPPPPTPSPSPEPNCTNVCINKQTLDPRDCSCNCLIDTYPCPFNEEFNPTICDCERLGDCPELVNDTCPPGEVFSLVNCTCVPECTLTCDSPKRLDENMCTCVCPPSIIPRNMECQSPLVFSEETCLCECPLDQSQCGPGQVLNVDDCSCGCPNVTSCPPGQSYDQSLCECRCDKEEVCCEGRVFNMDSCQCECANNTACPQGQSRNSDSCKCECDARSSEELWYEEFGKCWRDNYKIFSIFSCGCECPKFLTCPQGQSINTNTCRCECPPRPSSCQPPMIYNTRSCRCYCPRRYCGYGRYFNESTCRCECRPQQCPSGQRFNPSRCSCECSSQLSCPHGQRWDSRQCRCSCAYRLCPHGQQFDPHSCQCRCRQQHYYCSQGKRWDSTRCQCVCPPQQHRCPYGQTYSSSSCSCKCTRSCSHYETLNQRTCQCFRNYPTPRPPTRPPSPVPPRSCSGYHSQQACRASGLSCRWHQGRCISQCCQQSSSRYGRTTSQHVHHCHSYNNNKRYCDAKPYCSWTC